MIPIKFRVWNGFKMEYDVIAGKLGTFYAKGLDENDSACISPFNTIYSKETPVMQFTGLIDKNGREVYEGDIVKRMCMDDNCEMEHIGTVRKNELWLMYEIDDPKQDRGEIQFGAPLVYGDPSQNLTFPVEVIGTEYENAELLK